MPFLDNVKSRVKGEGHKAKLKADLLLLDRNIVSRKKNLGVEIYENLRDITCQQDFYATTDATISILRPELLAIDREIRAFDNRKMIAKGNLDLAMAVRREAFPNAAVNWKEKAANASKSAKMAANETKIKAELKVIETQTNGLKESFGLKIYPILEQHFGSSTDPIPVHCSTDEVTNKIRECFKQCKDDIININRSKVAKESRINQIDVDISLRSMGTN